MLKKLSKLLFSKKGEGPVTGMIWYGVLGVVCVGVAVAIWAGVGVTAKNTDTSLTTAGTTAATGATAAATAVMAGH